jgi:hypothetical protein
MITEVLMDGQGAICKVVRGFPTKLGSDLGAHGKAKIAAWHKPLDHPYKKGDLLAYEYGENARLDRLIRQRIWQEETKGEHFDFGVWHSKNVVPAPGMQVKVIPVHDYQGTHKDHRIEPQHIVTRGEPHTPGELERPCFPIVRRDPTRIGKGKIEEIHFDRKTVVERKKELEVHEHHISEMRRNLDKQDFSPTLRQKL